MKTQITLKSGITVTLSAILKESGVIKWNAKRNHFRVTAKANGERITFDFYGSENDYRKAVNELPESDLINAFESFVSDSVCGQSDFEDFCSDMGYDTDSRKAYKTWKPCQRSTAKLGKLDLGDVYELANEIQELAN